MTSIVFSNNSPDNLDRFLLSAMEKNIPLSFFILYSSEESNSEKYLSLFEKYKIISHKLVVDFKNDLLQTIDSDDNLVGFFKDTNYFFSEIRNFNVEEIMLDEEIFCFSLSLGKNVKHDTLNDCYNILLNEENIDEDIFKWNWLNHYLSFGRPLELGGGHIFHKKEILKMFKRWEFSDIKSLEESFEKLEYYPKEKMASFNHNVLIDVMYDSEDSFEKLKTYEFTNLDRAIIKI